MKKQLLISLEPFKDECLSSYINRLTIENLYNNPNWICKNIGTTRNRLIYTKANSSVIQELSNLTGVSIDKLNRLTYNLEFKFNEQLVVISEVIDSQNSKIFPLCLQENPYYKKIWNYKTVTACYKHNCLLIRKCTTCGRQISHYPDNMKICKCGEKLTELEPIKAYDLDIKYSMLVYHQSESVSNLLDVKIYPLFIRSLSLEEILYLTVRFMHSLDALNKKFIPFIRIRDELDGYQEFVRNVSRIFIDWPWGFRAYLKYYKKVYERAYEEDYSSGCHYSSLNFFVYKTLNCDRYYNFKFEFDQYIPFHLIREDVSENVLEIDWRPLGNIDLEKYDVDIDIVEKLIIDNKIVCFKYLQWSLDGKLIEENSLRYYVNYMKQFISKEDTLKRLGITSDTLDEFVEQNFIIYDEYLDELNNGKAYKEFDVNRMMAVLKKQ